MCALAITEKYSRASYSTTRKTNALPTKELRSDLLSGTYHASSVAIPPLSCELGSLDWTTVKSMRAVYKGGNENGNFKGKYYDGEDASMRYP